ncbi:hypothetical protein ACM66B_004844 [Microbotryomycetes sp. NB124-2]
MSQQGTLREREERLLAIVQALGHPTLASLEDFIFEHGHVAVVQVRDNLGEDTQTQGPAAVSRDYEQRYRLLKAELATRTKQLAAAHAELKTRTEQVGELTQARDVLRRDLEIVLSATSGEVPTAVPRVVNGSHGTGIEQNRSAPVFESAAPPLKEQIEYADEAGATEPANEPPVDSDAVMHSQARTIESHKSEYVSMLNNQAERDIREEPAPAQDYAEQNRLYQTLLEAYRSSRQDVLHNQEYVEQRWTPWVSANSQQFTAPPPPPPPAVADAFDFPDGAQLDLKRILQLYPALQKAEGDMKAARNEAKMWRTRMRQFLENVVSTSQQHGPSTPGRWVKKYRKRGSTFSTPGSPAPSTSRPAPPASSLVQKASEPNTVMNDTATSTKHDIVPPATREADFAPSLAEAEQCPLSCPLSPVDVNCSEQPGTISQMQSPSHVPVDAEGRSPTVLAQENGTHWPAVIKSQLLEPPQQQSYDAAAQASIELNRVRAASEVQTGIVALMDSPSMQQQPKHPAESTETVAEPAQQSKKHGSTNTTGLKRSRSTSDDFETPKSTRSVRLRQTVSVSALKEALDDEVPSAHSEELEYRKMIAEIQAKRRLEVEALRATRTPAKTTPKIPRVQDLANQSSRKKDIRQSMTGSSCEQCDNYYEVTSHGQPRNKVCTHVKPDQTHSPLNPLSRQARHDKNERLQNNSRHRSFRPIEADPPGYWDMHFPSTQQVEEYNRQATEQRRLQREEWF